MEKNSDNLLNLFNLPTEIQQEIAAYLDAPAIGFFAQSNKFALKNVLPMLRNYQAMFPVQLASKGSSTYVYQAKQLFASGSNAFGQLGLGDMKDRISFTAVPWPEDRGKIQQVIASAHTIVLTHNNRLWVCGYNYAGQLGLGDKVNRSFFTALPWLEERGRIQQIVAGNAHTVVLTQDNKLWVCGDNYYGQLGLGDRKDRVSFTAVPWPEERGRIQQIIAGGNRTIVLTQDNQLWVCGYNRYGQLGLGDTQHHSSFTSVPWPEDRGKIKQVIACHEITIVTTKDNKAWVCEYDWSTQHGLENNENLFTFTAKPWPEDLSGIQQVVTGSHHILILTKNKQLWVYGSNLYGQIGLEDKSDCSIIRAVPWFKERGKIQQIMAGWNHSIVLTNTNRLWVCGDNNCGQLGLGDKEKRFIFTPVKASSEAMKQFFIFNNNLNQLIKLGTSLTLTPGIEADNLHSQHQRDEPEGQRPLKKMRL